MARRLRSPNLTFDGALLEAMGDPRRASVLALLCTPDAGRMVDYTTTEIAEHLGLSKSVVSRHLQILKRVGLVTMKKDGKYRQYRLQFADLRRRVGDLHELLGRIEDTMTNAAAELAAEDGENV